MPLNQVICPICNCSAEQSFVNYNLPFFECDNCGRFAIGYEYLTKIDKGALYSVYPLSIIINVIIYLKLFTLTVITYNFHF